MLLLVRPSSVPVCRSMPHPPPPPAETNGSPRSGVVPPATPLASFLKRARENGRARMEAGTLMREQNGAGVVEGRQGAERVADGRNGRARGRVPRGLSGEGVSCCWGTVRGGREGREIDRIAWSARGLARYECNGNRESKSEGARDSDALHGEGWAGRGGEGGDEAGTGTRWVGEKEKVRR